jgi:hypothetical protein
MPTEFKLFPRLLITGLVLSYPLLLHRLQPHWPDFPGGALTLLPTLLHAWLAWIFGRTLQSGQEPLISTFARLERAHLLNLADPGLPPDLVHYTRILTHLWSGMFIVMALVSALLSLSAQLKWWTLFTGAISYMLVAALFLGEYVYRRFRFTHCPHANPLRLAWLLINSWSLWLRRTP